MVERLVKAAQLKRLVRESVAISSLGRRESSGKKHEEQPETLFHG